MASVRKGLEIFLYNDVYQIVKYYAAEMPSVKSKKTINLINSFITNEIIHKVSHAILKILKKDLREESMKTREEALNWLSLITIGHLWEALIFKRNNKQLEEMVDKYIDVLGLT